jgi:hypothetical protein
VVRIWGRRLLVAVAVAAVPLPVLGQEPAAAAGYVPTLADLLNRRTSELRTMVERVALDAGDLNRRWPVDYSPVQLQTFRGFYAAWQRRLGEVEFDKLSQEGKVDYLLLKNRLGHELSLLSRDEARFGEMRALLPFATAVMDLHERQRRMETMVPESAGRTVAQIAEQAGLATRAMDSAAGRPSRIVGLSRRGGSAEPARDPQALVRVLRRLRPDVHLVGQGPVRKGRRRPPAVRQGAPGKGGRGARRRRRSDHRRSHRTGGAGGGPGLRDDPLRAEDLVKIAEREFAWCEAEMLKASRAMGFGDDWRAAMEKVKTLHVQPGRQIDLVRDLAREAVTFIEQRNLVTVPPLAKDDWWEEMLSPAQQKVSPFFLGGSLIQVSYPTDAMAQEDKMMTMRGNNIHFSRATVFHELIPGHHLQWFMSDRYQPHRDLFGTPFWTEGWSLYWEMLLYDAGFPRSPEDRVGMLFWRMHRAARIIFSLRFHLGTMTPQEAIDLLVNRVGHERANATGRGAPVVQRQLSAAVPDRLHDGRIAVPRAAPGAGGQREDDRQGLSRRGAAVGDDAGGNGARAAHPAAAFGRPCGAVDVRRGAAVASVWTGGDAMDGTRPIRASRLAFIPGSASMLSHPGSLERV